MERCPKCGEPLEAGIGVCPRCGWVQLGQPPPTTAEQPATFAPAPSPLSSPPPLTLLQPQPPPPSSPTPPPLQPLPLASITPGAPPPADLSVRMEGRLLTFTPQGVPPGEPWAAVDPAPLLKVLAYLMLLVVGNVLVYVFIGVSSIELVRIVEVPGIDNTTTLQYRQGGLNPLAALGLVYSAVVLAYFPVLAYGLYRRRTWAWTHSLVGAAVGMAAFPMGTFLGPAIAYLLTRPMLREAMGTSFVGMRKPPPYGDRPAG